MTETLGQRIALRRRMLSLSQEAFGEKMGVSRQAISKWESDTAIPEVDRLIEMSRIFEVSVGWLLGTEKESMPEENVAAVPILLNTDSPADPVPEPSFEPVPDPEPVPPRVPFLWFLPLCSVLTVISLLISILAISRTGQTSSPTEPTKPPQSYEELLAQIAQLEKDLEVSNNRNEFFYERSFELMSEIGDTTTRLNDLEAYVYALPIASGLAGSLTQYEQFETWNLVGDLNSRLDTVRLFFSCCAGNDLNIHHITFYVMQGKEQVDYFPCIYNQKKNTYYTEFELPLDSGYRYEVEISYTNMPTTRFELTGHGMSDLVAAAQPKILSAMRSSSSAITQGGFGIAYQELILGAPPLMPKNYQWNWSTMRLVHYHNGEKVSEKDLTELIRQLHHSDDTLTFSFSSQSFSAIGSKEGDIHEFRLEGELTISYTSHMEENMKYPFSLVLETWENSGSGIYLK